MTGVQTCALPIWMTTSTSGIYAATKYAVVAMSETLALDIADAGGKVGVSVLSPAFFSTNIQHGAAQRPDDLAATAPQSEIRRQREQEGLVAMQKGRLSAEQIAEKTLDGVSAGSFYIFPHSGIKKVIAARAEAVQAEKAAFNPLAGI